MTYCRREDCIHYDVCAYKACKFVCPYYKCNTSVAELDKMPMISKEHKGGVEMTADEMLELVETVHKAVLPLGYEVITGLEEYNDGDVFHLFLSKLEEGGAE